MGVGSENCLRLFSFCCTGAILGCSPGANNTYTVPRALSAQVANCMLNIVAGMFKGGCNA